MKSQIIKKGEIDVSSTEESNDGNRSAITSIPFSSGGYIVSEKAIFIRNSLICVVNNQKCVIYSTKDCKRLFETQQNPDYLIGCKTFVYNGEYEILLTASSDGTILSHFIPKTLDNLEKYLNLVFKLKISCKRLLYIDVDERTGDLFYITLNDSIQISRLRLSYDKILFEQSLSYNADVIYVSKDNEGDNKIVLEDKVLLKVENDKIDLVAVNNDFTSFLITYNKSIVLMNISENLCYYYQHYNPITSILFYNNNDIILGDIIGQLILLSYTDSTNHADSLNTTNDFLTFTPNETINFNTLSEIYNSKEVKGFGFVRRIKSTIKVYHWHSHNINSLCLYKNLVLSGGEEGVIVFWNLESNERKYVTNLGSVVFHINSSSNLISTSLQNNSIALIDPASLHVLGTISSIQFTDSTNNERIVKVADNNHLCVVDKNIIQIYDYINNVEVNRVNVNSINYVSRQNFTYGFNYSVSKVCVSYNNKHVLIVLKRQVVTSEKDESYKFILQFYTLTSDNEMKEDGEKNSGIKICNKVYKLVNSIHNIHDNNEVMSLKEVNNSAIFISSSKENINIYTFNDDVKEWMVSRNLNYKNLLVTSVEFGRNFVFILYDHKILNIYNGIHSTRMKSASEQDLVLLKTFNLSKHNFNSMKPVDNETILLYNRKKITLFNIKSGEITPVHTVEDGEMTKVIYKYNLLVLLNQKDGGFFLELYNLQDPVRMNLLYKTAVNHPDLKLKLEIYSHWTTIVYNLLMINNYDVKIVKVFKTKEGYEVIDKVEGESELKYVKIKKQDYNFLREFIQQLLAPSKVTPQSTSKGTKRKSLCSMYQRKSRIKLNASEMLNYNYIPTPNYIINKICTQIQR